MTDGNFKMGIFEGEYLKNLYFHQSGDTVLYPVKTSSVLEGEVVFYLEVAEGIYLRSFPMRCVNTTNSLHQWLIGVIKGIDKSQVPGDLGPCIKEPNIQEITYHKVNYAVISIYNPNDLQVDISKIKEYGAFLKRDLGIGGDNTMTTTSNNVTMADMYEKHSVRLGMINTATDHSTKPFGIFTPSEITGNPHVISYRQNYRYRLAFRFTVNDKKIYVVNGESDYRTRNDDPVKLQEKAGDFIGELFEGLRNNEYAVVKKEDGEREVRIKVPGNCFYFTIGAGISIDDAINGFESSLKEVVNGLLVVPKTTP